jgi:MoaE-MoaD fusion protein
MRVTVRFFAILRDKAGATEAEIDLPAGATVSTAATAIAKRFPAIAGFVPRIAFAQNREYVQATQPLQDGDELALIPAVSGGSDVKTDWLALLSDPLPVAEAIAFVTDPSAGGIAVFLGATRAQISATGPSLLALDYEAYEQMAAQQFGKLAAEVHRKYPVAKLVILHRVGRVSVGEPSVLIAVSTPHRAEAFDVCRWLIDSIKSHATIWKKEVWSDGTATWVDPL